MTNGVPDTANPSDAAACATVDAEDATNLLGDMASRMMAAGVPPEGFAALLVGAAAGVVAGAGEGADRDAFLALCGQVWDAVHAAPDAAPAP